MGFEPEEHEAVIATVARALAVAGGAREVAVLTYAEARFSESGYDSWNGGQTFFTLDLIIPSQLFEQLRPHRSVVEQNILNSLEQVFERYEADFISALRLLQALNKNPNWRPQAESWLRGETVNNQGRVRSDNVAPLEYEGLLFRSEAEKNLYAALKTKGIPIAPLPVFVQGGADYQRIEPDLLVVNEGLMMVVEVDGDTFHHETPASAAKRLEMLTSHGIQVSRVRAEDCLTSERAEVTARKILDYLRKLKLAGK